MSLTSNLKHPISKAPESDSAGIGTLWPLKFTRARALGDRIAWLYAARRRAHRLGFDFFRRSNFSVPDALKINGRRQSIVCPAEMGCTHDFIDAFLGDAYGLEFIRRTHGESKTIVDIGANVGWFSLAARHLNPHATLTAYEPNSEVIEILRANTANLDIAVFPEAVGACNGSVGLTASSQSNQVRVMETGTIPQVGLATALERAGGTIDILKLDCEGSEWGMFKVEEPWRHIGWLTMEYHLWAEPNATHEHAPRVVESLGFEVVEQKRDREWGLMLARRRQ